MTLLIRRKYSGFPFKGWQLIPLLFVSIVSCNKFLDKKSDNSLVVPKTVMDLQALLDDAGTMNRATVSFSEASADDYFLLASTYDSRPVRQQNVYIWTPYEYSFQNDWSLSYLPVYNSNLCLELVEKIQKTATNELQWNNVKGSALFYRAYHFLNLTWAYAKAYDESSFDKDLGIVLRITSDFNTSSVRSTTKESYDRIITDARNAAMYLPNNPQHVMRPSKAAAYGLLARAHLSMRQYDSAWKYANLCLQIKNELLDYNSEVNATTNTPFKPFNKETIFYSEMNTISGIHTPSRAKIDTALYSSYISDDLRKKAYFRSSSGFQMFKGSHAESTAILFSGISTNEIYMIRAECFARKNQIAEAMTDLNNLLEKRWSTGTFVPFTALNQQQALNLILTERRKELIMRGLRWPDLKRLNKEGANITPKRIVKSQIYTLPPNDNRYALPLPKDIIDQTGMPQN